MPQLHFVPASFALPLLPLTAATRTSRPSSFSQTDIFWTLVDDVIGATVVGVGRGRFRVRGREAEDGGYEFLDCFSDVIECHDGLV